MRFAPFLLAALLVPALAVAPSCRRHEEPLPPPPAKPVSIWSDADAQAVARQLVEATAQETWTSQFRDRNQRPARIRIGNITDKSGQDVAIDGFVAALAQAVSAAGGDRLVLATEDADYSVDGSVGATPGKGTDGTPAVFFAIDLAFTLISSGDKVSHFAVEREVRQR